MIHFMKMKKRRRNQNSSTKNPVAFMKVFMLPKPILKLTLVLMLIRIEYYQGVFIR